MATEARIDSLIYEICEHFGEMPDKVMGHVDEFNRQGGNEVGLMAAFEAAKDRSYGYFRALLKAEKYINMEPAEPKAGSDVVSWAHARYHNAQANPEIDTAAKRLARKAGLKTVRCPCGELHNVMQEGTWSR